MVNNAIANKPSAAAKKRCTTSGITFSMSTGFSGNLLFAASIASGV